MQSPYLAAIGAMLLGAALLAWSIGQTLSLLREWLVARLPVAAQQAVSFPAAGRYDLYVQHPRLAGELLRAKFSLQDAGGAEVPSAAVLAQMQSSGFSTVTTAVRSFQVPAAGSYRLVVGAGLPDRNVSDFALVFMRPWAMALVPRVLGMILGGAGLVGGLVLFALKRTGKI